MDQGGRPHCSQKKGVAAAAAHLRWAAPKCYRSSHPGATERLRRLSPMSHREVWCGDAHTPFQSCVLGWTGPSEMDTLHECRK